MASGSNASAVIIKRKKVVGGGGHHGGAWKVAYADFVTAMMAFFLLMWLLNATTEKQRKGIADYFQPTIAVNRISGGGDGALGGDSIFTDDDLAQSGTGGGQDASRAVDEEQRRTEDQVFGEMQELLRGNSGESLVSDEMRRHIVTRITDEGLVVELFSREGAPLFGGDGTQATPLLSSLLAVIGRVFSLAENDIAVTGHVRARPLTLIDNPVWDRSVGRSEVVHEELARRLGEARFARITGKGDRRPSRDSMDPMSPRHDRVEITLLRSDIPR
ncbi:flagellar motor protein MotB [Roseicyclus sp. F158]|uniref:Flagellar motor protein MotB n=1 Tax=Tropicimonas omnivorans TaxID=3075590 RepID=A0ABU3DD72_9RHOB|nr:flagellar motor protein MotB [Roseicyclus sp. F158]MDT0681666.1 flagellar motor protein MotB [Roseicyclus sp. F158]